MTTVNLIIVLFIAGDAVTLESLAQDQMPDRSCFKIKVKCTLERFGNSPGKQVAKKEELNEIQTIVVKSINSIFRCENTERNSARELISDSEINLQLVRDPKEIFVARRKSNQAFPVYNSGLWPFSYFLYDSIYLNKRLAIFIETVPTTTDYFAFGLRGQTLKFTRGSDELTISYVLRPKPVVIEANWKLHHKEGKKTKMQTNGFQIQTLSDPNDVLPFKMLVVTTSLHTDNELNARAVETVTVLESTRVVPDSDFRVTIDIPNGTWVQNDIDPTIRYMWQDGEVVPDPGSKEVLVPLGQAAFFKEKSAPLWPWMAGGLVVVLTLAGLIGWKVATR